MQYLDYITLTGILILVSLYLNNYQPPIKRQNIALIVMAFGLVLGWFMVHNSAYGFLIAGLVFFKDEFIDRAFFKGFIAFHPQTSPADFVLYVNRKKDGTIPVPS